MRTRFIAGLGVLLCVHSPAMAKDTPAQPLAPASVQNAERLDRLPPLHPDTVTAKPKIDRSGRAQQGKASYYGKYFNARSMADGRRMDPDTDIAASKTLPIGTTAKVVNLNNGKSATVKVEDRGPYVKGRVVDVTPKIANQLGMKQKGVVPVIVKPITVPMPDGGVKLGAGAATASQEQIQAAAQTTEQVVSRKPAAPAGHSVAETASR